MASREALDKAYMTCAFAIAELSQARRKKVGAILVAQNCGIIAEGFNGTPVKFDNNCEDDFVQYDEDPQLYPVEPGTGTVLITKPECIHAESNAIMKIARSHNKSVGATLYCTLTPCFECAKLIIQAGIIRVVYAEQYPYVGHAGAARPLGLELLTKARIQIDKLDGFTEH